MKTTLTNYSNPIVQMEKMFDNIFNTTPLFHSLDEVYRTGDQVRFYSDETGLTVQVDLPGVKKSDLDLSTDSNSREVYVKAKRVIKSGSDEREQTYNRSFTVHRDFDLDKIEFNYTNGSLEVFLPRRKKEEYIKKYKV